jgi:hypothetical protein
MQDQPFLLHADQNLAHRGGEPVLLSVNLAERRSSGNGHGNYDPIDFSCLSNSRRPLRSRFSTRS